MLHLFLLSLLRKLVAKTNNYENNKQNNPYVDCVVHCNILTVDGMRQAGGHLRWRCNGVYE